MKLNPINNTLEMKEIRMILAIFFLVWGEGTCGQSSDKYDIYYLAVGNQHCARADANSFSHDLLDVKGANISAELMADYLDSAGSKYGVLLQSKVNSFISKDDILNSIEDVSDHMDYDSRNERLFVFYYCGHGLGEAVSGRQYIVPGDAVFDSACFVDKYLDLGDLETDLVYSVDLLQSIRKYSDQQLVLFDCCYEEPGEEKVLDHFTNNLGTALNGFVKDLREIHQFRHRDNTVVYTGIPGSSVRPVSPPTFLKERVLPEKLGSICRRFCTYSKIAFEDGGGSYHQFLNQMKDPTFDTLTNEVTVYSNLPWLDKSFMSLDRSLNSQRENRLGSARKSVVIKAKGESGIREPIHVMEAVDGYIEVSSEDGDWIGGGAKLKLTPLEGEIVVMNQWDRLLVHFQEHEEYEYFNFEFILPQQYSTSDQKPEVQDFYWMDHAEAEISATGRACSNSISSVEVVKLKRDALNRLKLVHLNFTHRCSDSGAIMEGTISLNLSPIIAK